MFKRLAIAIAGVALAATACLAAQDGKLKKEELDQLLAPIALYPDEVLSNILMASTYPLDVVQAARWRKEPANAKLKGDALAKALDDKIWDPSIKALVQFPDVLEQMNEKLEWTQKLGDAFLAQQDQVLDEIQFLRAKADAAGKLKSNDKQKVTKKRGSSSDSEAIIIEPASPEYVYVPAYDPRVVYGDWWYPDYPPLSWPHVEHYYDGYYWGTGIAVAAAIWGWSRCDWWRRDIDIDINNWNRINHHRFALASNRWQHRPDQRGPVPYRNKDVRQKFKQVDRRPASSKEFRGHVENRLAGTDRSNRKDRSGNYSGPKGKDRKAAKSRDLAKSGRVGRPAAKRSAGALDVRRGADVRRYSKRGHSSRMAMPRRSYSGPRGFSGARGSRGRRSFGGRRR